MVPQLNDTHTRKLFILTGNHNSKIGIQDHIDIIFSLFANDFDISLSDAPKPGYDNLVIEEFTNPRFVKAMYDSIASNQNTKFHLLMTEIPSRIDGQITLNPFILNSHSTFFRGIFLLLLKMRPYINQVRSVSKSVPLFYRLKNFYQRIVSRLSSSQRTYPFIKLNNILSKIGQLSRVLALKNFITPSKIRQMKKTWRIKTFNSFLNNKYSAYKLFLEQQYYIAYMSDRAEKLEKNINLFHTILDMHSTITEGIKTVFERESITLLPPIKKTIAPKIKDIKNTLIIYSTGANTPYRTQVIESLAHQCKTELKNTIIEAKGFVSNNELCSQASCTINIPQSSTWPFSSPVRIYRSYNAGIIPIIYKKFSDHPIEKCGVLWDDFVIQKKRGTLGKITKSIDAELFAYNKLIEGSYKKIVKQLDITPVSVQNLPSKNDIFEEFFGGNPEMIGSIHGLSQNVNFLRYANQYLIVPQMSYPLDLKLKKNFKKYGNVSLQKVSNMIFKEAEAIENSKKSIPIGRINQTIFQKFENNLSVSSPQAENSKLIKRQEAKEISDALRIALKSLDKTSAYFSDNNSFLKFKVRKSDDETYIVKRNNFTRKIIRFKNINHITQFLTTKLIQFLKSGEKIVICKLKNHNIITQSGSLFIHEKQNKAFNFNDFGNSGTIKLYSINHLYYWLNDSLAERNEI